MTAIKMIPREEYLLGLPKKRMAAGVLIENSKGEVLLLKTSYKDSWEIPGGVTEKGESPAQCAQRETLEEIGIDIAVGQLLALEYKRTEVDDGLTFIFDGGFIGSKEIIIDNHEIIETRFVHKEKIAEYVSHIGLLERIKKAFLGKVNGPQYYESL